jgi:hypothetical protein
MKKTKLLITSLLFAFTCYCQFSSNYVRLPERTGAELQTPYMVNLLSRPVKLLDIPNLSGSPFLSNEFKPGFVKIKSGFYQYDVPIRFNIYQNVLEFHKEGKELELDSLELAVYLEVAGDSSTIRVLKTGYPAIDKQTERSIYEVMAMGPQAHFLKYRVQKIEDVKSMGEFNKKEIVTISDYYIYKPGIGIFKIKLSANALINLFPAEKNRINDIIDRKRLNLKKELDFGELITELNKAETT